MFGVFLIYAIRMVVALFWLFMQYFLLLVRFQFLSWRLLSASTCSEVLIYQIIFYKLYIKGQLICGRCVLCLKVNFVFNVFWLIFCQFLKMQILRIKFDFLLIPYIYPIVSKFTYIYRGWYRQCSSLVHEQVQKIVFHNVKNLVASYYCTIIAWSAFYMINSFWSILPCRLIF